jgi:4-amino-4-deoxychorismate lyase
MPQRSDPSCVHGIFETLAVIDGRPRLLQRHLTRLFDGCRRLGMRAPAESVLLAEIAAQAALPGPGVVKVIVHAGAGADPDTAQQLVRAEPPRQRPAAWAQAGVSIITCRTRLAIAPELAGLKLLDRGVQERARREWNSDSIAEGLLLDADGRLVSGTMTNVYAVIDGRLCTPPITRCGVAGVMRAEFLEAWRSSAQSIVIRDIDPAELETASEIFLSNALIGVWPVRSLDGRAFSVGLAACFAAAHVQRIVKESHPSFAGATDLRFPPR